VLSGSRTSIETLNGRRLFVADSVNDDSTQP